MVLAGPCPQNKLPLKPVVGQQPYGTVVAGGVRRPYGTVVTGGVRRRVRSVGRCTDASVDDFERQVKAY